MAQEKNKKLKLTDKEREALKKYFGYAHIKINTVISLEPYILDTLRKKGWDLDLKQTNLQEVLEDFVNMYATIYKNGDNNKQRRLYRGTTSLEKRQLEENGEIRKVLSTSISEEIAEKFCNSNTRAIFEVITKNLPTIDVEQEKQDIRREDEVCILPFAKVKSIQELKKEKDITYYKIKLEKQELEKLEPYEIEKSKKECIDEFEQYIKDLEEYNRIGDRIDRFTYIYNKETTTVEDKRYIAKDKEIEYENIYKITGDIREFQKKILRLIKGLCKEKELEIDQKKEEKLNQNNKDEIHGRIEEEEKSQEKPENEEYQKKINDLKQNINVSLVDIETSLEQNLEKVKENVKKYRELAQNLGIEYTKEISSRLIDNFENVKKQIQQISKQIEEEIDYTEENYNELVEKRGNLKKAQCELEGIVDLVEIHKRQSKSQIRENLNNKIQTNIKKTKLKKLQEEKHKRRNKKFNIFQKITGEGKLNEEIIRNIQMKETFTKEEMRNYENSVQIAIQDIYDCIYENGLEKKPPSELLNIISSIKQNKEKLGFKEEKQYIENAKRKSIDSYPIAQNDLKPRILKNKMITAIQTDTELTEQRIKKERENQKERKRNFTYANNNNDAITQLEGKTGIIYFTIKEEAKEERQNENKENPKKLENSKISEVEVKTKIERI